MRGKTDALVAGLRAFGLTFPGAHRKAPWPEHDDLAVNDKTFAYLPAAYGLGRSGWVLFNPADSKIPSIGQLREWIDESYRAQAPKRLVRELDTAMDRGAGR